MQMYIWKVNDYSFGNLCSNKKPKQRQTKKFDRCNKIRLWQLNFIGEKLV